MMRTVLSGSRVSIIAFMALGLAALLFVLVSGPQLALARPVSQTTGDTIVSSLTNAFNAKDLNSCLALMTDDAMVKVVNPSDIATGKLTNDTLTYTGKQGLQSQLSNFFTVNFTNGFTIKSTNFKTTNTSFSGPMQLAIRNFVVETDVAATLEGGKIKTLVITDKSISASGSQPGPVPSSSPATGTGGRDLTVSESQIRTSAIFLLVVTGTTSLFGLGWLKRRRKSR